MKEPKLTYSKYSHLIKVQGRSYLYHLASGRICALQPEMTDIIPDTVDEPCRLASIHPDLYAALTDNEFIVAENVDSTKEAIKSFTEYDTDPALFEITINPTLDCNLRCWYCYEEHLKGTGMQPETMDAIKHLIDCKVSDTRLKHLAITFFGGEPLLKWKDVVKPLIKYGVGSARERGIGFNTGFTTNGVLLTRDKFSFLEQLGLRGTSFQISFDGSRAIHDRSRVYDAAHPTFDRMLEAVRTGAEMGFSMCVRFNYKADTLDSFGEVVDLMSAWPEETRRHITVNLQQVWQDSQGANNEIKGRAAAMQERIRSLGMHSECDMVYHRHICYADRENNVCINYNGDVYKCTARKFIADNREGRLLPDGSIKYNDRYRRRMAVKYSNPACLSCMIMPICNGRCSQGKLEASDPTVCYLGMDDSRKERYMLGSLICRLTGESLPDSELQQIPFTVTSLSSNNQHFNNP